MKFSVLIPTYAPTVDVEDKLDRCIRVILGRTDFSDGELVIVEQGKAVACESVARHNRVFGLRFKYSHTSEPAGFAKAVNRGVEMCEGDYLLIVNNDIIVDERWAEKLISAYERVPNAGMLYPSVGDPNISSYNKEKIHSPGSWWSCVCISRKVWEDVGRLDEDKLNYRFHDQNWSLTAHFKGYVVGRYLGSHVLHDDCSTYKHMKIDETPERTEMIRRWGVEHFSDHPDMPAMVYTNI